MHKGSRFNSNHLKHMDYHQLKRAKDQLEAHNTKESLITFRKKLLNDQKKHNFSMEYDKIRGMLANSVLPGRTGQHLMDRAAELKKLGAKALSIN